MEGVLTLATLYGGMGDQSAAGCRAADGLAPGDFSAPCRTGEAAGEAAQSSFLCIDFSLNFRYSKGLVRSCA